MKTLKLILLGILISIGLNGQDLEEEQLYIQIYDTDVDSIIVREPTKDELPVVLQIMLLYKEHCYNDSTLAHTFNYSNRCYGVEGNLSPGYNIKIVCDDSTHYYWTHKEPTMSDFYIWFNEKYGF